MTKLVDCIRDLETLTSQSTRLDIALEGENNKPKVYTNTQKFRCDSCKTNFGDPKLEGVKISRMHTRGSKTLTSKST